MNEETNIALVKEVYDAYLKGDGERLLSYLAPDVAWEVPELPALPFAGKRQGRDSVGQFFQLVSEAQQLRDFRVEQVIAQDDHVVVLGHYEWTVKDNDADWGSDWVHIMTVRDGKIAAFREMTNTHCALEAFRSGKPTTHRNNPAADASSQSSLH